MEEIKIIFKRLNNKLISIKLIKFLECIGINFLRIKTYGQKSKKILEEQDPT